MIRGETAVGREGRVLKALVVLVVFALGLIVAAPAMAGKDPLAGGSTKLNFKLPKKTKVGAISPAKKVAKTTIKLKIKSGSMDPVTCTGSEKLKGGFKFKYKGNKVKVKQVKAAFGGPVYTPHSGALKGKVGKKSNVRIAKITGGKCGRNGFGAKITNAKMKLTKAGAKALDKGLGHKNKPFKKGAKFGTASTKTVPKTVDVNSGSASLTANTITLTKLGSKGVRADHGGVSPIAPATASLATLNFTFPIGGGTIAPNGNDGQLNAKGGALFWKTDSTASGDIAACNASTPFSAVGTDSGTHNTLTSIGLNLFSNQLFATVDVVGGNLNTLHAPATTIADITSKGVSSNPSTRTITITTPALAFTSAAAGTVNAIYGDTTSPSVTCGSSLVGGDSLGAMTITVHTH